MVVLDLLLGRAMDDALHRRFLETGSKEDLQLLMQKHYGTIHAHIAKIVNNYHDADENHKCDLSQSL